MGICVFSPRGPDDAGDGLGLRLHLLRHRVHQPSGQRQIVRNDPVTPDADPGPRRVRTGFISASALGLSRIARRPSGRIMPPLPPVRSVQVTPPDTINRRYRL
jgi:hypothetical protein